MSLSIQQAAEKAVNLGKQLKAVIEVGEFLEEVGSFKNTHAEAEKMAKKAKVDQEKAEESCSKVCKDLKEAEGKYSQVQKDTKALLVKTEFDRAAVIKSATDQSIKMVNNAKDDVDAVHKSASYGVKILSDKKTVLEADCKKLSSDYDKLKSDMAKLKERLG